MDNAGNRTSKTDWQAGVTSNYSYDAIYQLTQVLQGANTTESYSYDPVGNRLSSLGVSPYSYNSSNELTSTPSATYGYDLNGNAVTKNDSTGITTYAWDFENRLTSVTLPGSSGTVSFKYDPFGRRIYKSSSTAISIFAYDGDNQIEETNSSGAVVARYSQGLNIDEPLAILRSATTSFYNADGLGTITSLASTGGALAQTYAFDSFGKQTASSGSLTNPFQYTGREFDSEAGLFYYRARYYDPSTERFLSEDTQRFRVGSDFYSYVLNDPLDNSDPYGLEPEGCKDCKGKFIQGLMVGKRCCADEPTMSSSAANPYFPWEGYAGINAGMMFRHGGNGAWGQVVRSCLLCMYRHGATANQAHWYCYFNADRRVTRGQAVRGWARAIAAGAGIETEQVLDFASNSPDPSTMQDWGPWVQLFTGKW